MKSRKIRRCNRCKNIVDRSKLKEYEYTCNCCGEDLYGFETYKTKKKLK